MPRQRRLRLGTNGHEVTEGGFGLQDRVRRSALRTLPAGRANSMWMGARRAFADLPEDGPAAP